MTTSVEESAPPAAITAPREGMFDGLLEPARYVVDTVRGLVQLGSLTAYYMVRGRLRRDAIFEQMYEIGNKSLVFIAFTLGFLGMILIYQAAFQAQRITGDLQMLGGLFLQLLLREFAPTITAMMLATRVATGMAAQLGSMVVTEQIDALKMCAAQPVEYLVVPRFIASTVMTVALTIFAVLVSYTAGALCANFFFAVNFRTFFDLGFVGGFDICIGLSKALAYGMVIPLIACHAGFGVHGGSEGVGRATTQAVVNASLAVVILDFLISGIGFVILSVFL